MTFEQYRIIVESIIIESNNQRDLLLSIKSSLDALALARSITTEMQCVINIEKQISILKEKQEELNNAYILVENVKFNPMLDQMMAQIDRSIIEATTEFVSATETLIASYKSKWGK